MAKRIINVVLLLACFGSLSCLKQLGQEPGAAKVGERCERDRNCIRNAYCRVQMTCLCDQYYSPTLDKSMCIASAGLSCTNDLACSTMTNAECNQGVCACRDSYTLDISNSSNCISRPSTVDDRCQRTDDCQDALGRALCIDGHCRCITSYHFATETGKCIQTRLLYNACAVDYECIGFDNENALECRNGECVCKEGGATCSRASTLAVLGVFMAILPLVHSSI